MHHQKPERDKLCMKKKEGGRGLLPFEVAYKEDIINIAEYVKTKYKEETL
jgi:hypothetical protein